MLEQADDEVRVKVKEWVMRGAPPPPDSYLRDAWTMNGLLSAVPEFAHEANVGVSERTSDDDEGYAAYRQQFDRLARSPSVVICTHAMLAILAKRRQSAQNRALMSNDEADLSATIQKWKALPLDERKSLRLHEIINSAMQTHDTEVGLDILPAIDLLIVDEGHQFEDAVHGICNRSASLFSLRRAARELHNAHAKAFAAPHALDDLFEKFSGLNVADDEIIKMDEHTVNGTSLLEMLAHGMSTVLTPKASASKKAIEEAKQTAQWRYLSAVERSVRLAHELKQRTNDGVGAVLHWSPTRKWPRVLIGRHSVAKELDYIWRVVAQRSIIVSGTIYELLPSPNCESLRRSLSVEYNSMVTMQPIHAPWQIDPVTMCIVQPLKAPDGRDRFCRPKADGLSDGKLQDAWRDDVARYTSDAYRVAVGGVLVVGTAYADIDAVAKFLAEHHPDIPLLQQKPGVPLMGLRERFLDLARQGKRPVLLGVGAAWTGLDIYAPDIPNALTDLIVLNSPFGVINRTLSRMLRIASKTGNFETTALVTRLVRQVIGRLVRSPDTPHNRRIHWLDARIYMPSLAGMLLPVRRVLERYKTISVG